MKYVMTDISVWLLVIRNDIIQSVLLCIIIVVNIIGQVLILFNIQLWYSANYYCGVL